ncbi:protein [Scardovia inopinata]|uniref:Alcohol dehydrogenase n=1 Tax=Scardovia inopinata F0304 TaxID=641146 RepID=W5IK45_SCAIO|nr:hypothetical protein [Scardovia inopinata]EFG27267.1 hypothetical protein HMPREF9020_00908 [Scardovia inopinata F0304]BAR06879.1 putative alcohol dehydrogenase [Scardovia inopinata JCM 12537]SUV50944.1 protein [Scardovia inopinata]
MSNREDQQAPVSYSWPGWVRLTLSLLAGCAVGLIGTVSHRMGAAYNIPYGMVLSLLIVLGSAWSARARSGYADLVLHFVSSTATAWGLALTSKASSALVATGSVAFHTYFSTHVWQWWLYGIIVIQVVVAFFPASWFSSAKVKHDRG